MEVQAKQLLAAFDDGPMPARGRGRPAASMAGQVFRTLRSAIVTMRLKPGEALSEQEIADRLKVSRQPVREAFIKLSEIGLLRVLPQQLREEFAVPVRRPFQQQHAQARGEHLDADDIGVVSDELLVRLGFDAERVFAGAALRAGEVEDDGLAGAVFQGG